MKWKTKKTLIFIIPLVLIIVASVFFLVIFLPKQMTSETYYNAYNNSKLTKQEQITTILDGDNLVYEKTETLIFDNDKIYHKIIEKTLSVDINKYFDETVVEYYYTKDKMYYLENDTWKTKDFKFEDNLKNYEFKDSYFESFVFEKDIISKADFKGKIKNENLNNVLGFENDFKDAELVITINFEAKIQALNITAKTGQNRDVVIKNSFSYEKQNVVLPS